MRFVLPLLPPQKTQEMTLRDYFAAQALVGRLADGTDRDYASVAEEAYMYAEAMLRAGDE